MPLETSGRSGTAGAHWSESVFGNELMTEFISEVPDPLSAVTVGALQDMGYTVNYSAADFYSLPGHLMASAESTASDTNAAQSLAGLGLADTANAPVLVAGNGGSVTGGLALFTNYLASTFVTPPGEGTGAVVGTQSSDQSFLTTPLA